MNVEWILILRLCCLVNCFLMVHAGDCVNQQYVKEEHEPIRQMYQSSWGGIGYIKRIISGANISFQVSDDIKRKLCACAIYHRNRNTDGHTKREYNEILNNLGKIKEDLVNIRIDYMYFLWNWFETPALLCTSGTDSVGIAKSYTTKAIFRKVYDIYVLNTTKYGVGGHFLGVIKNVNV